jgi:hypothetical protein
MTIVNAPPLAERDGWREVKKASEWRLLRVGGRR